MKRILLAYSGSVATSAAIPWLAETFGAEIVTLTLDVGQGMELAHVREGALAAGARRAHVIDARDEFVCEYVLPALHAGAFASPRAFAGNTLTRPLIAKRLVDIARMERASAVAHGCRRGRPDRDRLERAIRFFDPGLEILAPACAWNMSPEALNEYARARGIRVAASDPQSNVDVNLLGRTLHGRTSEHDYRLTRSPTDAPREAAVIDIEFTNGLPVRTNGVDMSVIEMIESIETIAGAHGIGRVAVDADVTAESPAAVVLHAAYAHLSALDESGGTCLTGSVRVQLLKGSCEVVGHTILARTHEQEAAS